MLKTFKYRLYPNKNQANLLQQSFGCVRFVYNWGLAEKTKEYNNTGITLSCFDLSVKLAQELKKQHDWLNIPYSQCLQMSLRNLDNAYTKFFNKECKFPKYKKKGQCRKSCQYPQGVNIDWCRNYIKIPKIGKVKVVLHRKFTGKIKTVTVSQNAAGQYFIAVLADSNDATQIKSKIDHNNAIGIDLGLKHFTCDTNGHKTQAPKPLKKVVKRIARLNSLKSKMRKGSNNKKRLQLKINKLYNKAKNIRHDFLHKLSHKLIRENQTICLETLGIQEMLQKSHVSGDISDVSWGIFIEYLKYKAEWYGGNILQISPFLPSTKLCSECGHLENGLTLSERKWTCAACNILHDRDINAAKNIKHFALVGNQPKSPLKREVA